MTKEERREYNRKYYKENPQRIREIQRKYRGKNAEKERERVLKYYKENLEKVKEKQRKCREKNPKEIRERDRKYYEENPGKIREIQRKSWQKSTENITDAYVKRRIRAYCGLKSISQDVIESTKMYIKVKRLIKTKKDENTKTS